MPRDHEFARNDADSAFSLAATLNDETGMEIRSQMLQTVHDLKNWVSGIKLICRGALLEPSTASDLRIAIEQIQTAGDEAARLCEEILSDGKESDDNSQNTNHDANKLLSKVQSLIAGTLPDEVELRWEVNSNLPLRQGVGRDLGGVLLNLIQNGIEALQRKPGCITVRSQVLTEADQEMAEPAERLPMGFSHILLIEVEDTGCGMDETTRSQIFEPTFSTKLTGHGVGLASVREIVEQHHGRIELETAPGRGTRFRLWFPCEASLGTTNLVEENISREPMPDNEGVRLLLVDDDRTVRKMGKKLLENRGFAVTTSETAEEAANILASNGTDFSVILLDLHLPDLSPKEAFLKLQCILPHLPIIVVSGSTPRELKAKLGDLEPDGHVQKPFDVDMLISAIHQVIARAEQTI